MDSPFCRGGSHHPAGPPAGAVAGVIAVGLFDVKEELFPAFLVRDLTDFGGQALALEQLQFIVELFLGIKSIQLGPVGGKEPEFYKMFVQDPISSDAFRR